MKYGLTLTLIGIFFAIYALWLGWWGLPLWWAAASFLFVGEAYFFNRPDFLGKRLGGVQEALTKLPMLPYLVYVYVVWLVVRMLRNEDAFATLHDGVLIGRRLFPSELPDGVERVVDLTAEFSVHRSWQYDREVICIPTLDGLPFSDLDRVLDCYEAMESESKLTYVHCAEGHGRTGMFASGWLLYRGACDNPAAAVAEVQRVRHRVKLSKTQFELLKTLADKISKSTPALR